MDLEPEIFDWIERYLQGEMSSEELAHFETLIASDESLRKKVERQQSFSYTLKSYANRLKLREELNRYQGELKTEEDVPGSRSMGATMSSPDFMSRSKKIALAAAASILILFSFATFNYLNVRRIEGQITQVRALKREVESVRKTQHVLISQFDKSHLLAGTPNYGGTGFLISSRGYLATNFHVVENADSIYVQNIKGRLFKCVTVFRNKEYDLAILKIKDSTFYLNKAIPYYFSRQRPELGEQIYTLGFPRDEIVYNEGYMSSATGYLGDTLTYQLSVPVNPGNSGGPVLDDHGRVLGIISSKQTQADGVSFAVRSSVLMNALNTLENDSLRRQLVLPSRVKAFTTGSRVQQIKRTEEFVFLVKAF